jgi:hypothetical protein
MKLREAYNAVPEGHKQAFLDRCAERLRLRHNELSSSLPEADFRAWFAGKFLPAMNRIAVQSDKNRKANASVGSYDSLMTIEDFENG